MYFQWRGECAAGYFCEGLLSPSNQYLQKTSPLSRLRERGEVVFSAAKSHAYPLLKTPKYDNLARIYDHPLF